MVKNLPANAGDLRNFCSITGSGRFPWRREWLPIPVFLPEESHGQRSLEGYSPWGRTESDATEVMHGRKHLLKSSPLAEKLTSTLAGGDSNLDQWLHPAPHEFQKESESGQGSF